MLVAEPDTRANIWRRPKIETREPFDFVPRGAPELLLHAHDVCAGLRVPFQPEFARLAHLTMDGDPWIDMLRSSGRRPGPEQ